MQIWIVWDTGYDVLEKEVISKSGNQGVIIKDSLEFIIGELYYIIWILNHKKAIETYTI